MGLTAEEIKKIDEALMALRRSLKDELENIPANSRASVKMDDSFLKMIGETYLSGESPGLIGLLLDSGLLAGEPRCGNWAGCSPQRDCVCGSTCAQPGKGTCSGVSL